MAVQLLHHEEVVCSDQCFAAWHTGHEICMSLLQSYNEALTKVMGVLALGVLFGPGD